MTADRCITLRLDSLASGELIAGSLCDEHGDEHPFAGWLVLLTLLEQARLRHVHGSPEEEVRPAAIEVHGAPAEPPTAPEDEVERIRRSVDACSRGDFDEMLASWAPDCVLDWSNSRGFEAGVYRGHGEIRAFMERIREPFDEVRIELLEEPVEVEDGVVVVENIAYNRGREGIEVQARSTWLLRSRDGQTASLTLYQTKQEALEAARKS
ncbi:MAG TPA: nuclear transport factor 2 family protein [Solirubrobacterales bacterium]|jgi:ketosteroid isomerase-like protein